MIKMGRWFMAIWIAGIFNLSGFAAPAFGCTKGMKQKDFKNLVPIEGHPNMFLTKDVPQKVAELETYTLVFSSSSGLAAVLGQSQPVAVPSGSSVADEIRSNFARLLKQLSDIYKAPAEQVDGSPVFSWNHQVSFKLPRSIQQITLAIVSFPDSKVNIQLEYRFANYDEAIRENSGL